MAKTRPATMVQHLPALWVESVANSSIQEVEGTADEGIHLRMSGIDSIFLLVDFLDTPYTISNKNYYYTLMVYQGELKGLLRCTILALAKQNFTWLLSSSSSRLQLKYYHPKNILIFNYSTMQILVLNISLIEHKKLPSN